MSGQRLVNKQRGTDRDRQTDTERGTKTDRQRHKERDRESGGETETETHTHRQGQPDRQRHRERHTEKRERFCTESIPNSRTVINRHSAGPISQHVHVIDMFSSFAEWLTGKTLACTKGVYELGN